MSLTVPLSDIAIDLYPSKDFNKLNPNSIHGASINERTTVVLQKEFLHR